jgi:hypothetical protein
MQYTSTYMTLTSCTWKKYYSNQNKFLLHNKKSYFEVIAKKINGPLR